MYLANENLTIMSLQEQERKMEEIPCNPELTRDDINRYVGYCTAEGCSICRRMMQKARVIATGAPASCRKNLEMTCYADHFSMRFWSGDRGNKIVIQIEDEDEISVIVEQRTWRQSIRDLFKRVWEQLTGIKLMVVLRMPLDNSRLSAPLMLLQESDPSVDFHNFKTGIFYKF